MRISDWSSDVCSSDLEEVGAYVGRHAALEIAIARKHAGRDDVVLVDRLRDRGRVRPRIADAGGAAIADEVDAERVEIVGQPGFGAICGNDLAARCDRVLEPRLGLLPFVPFLAGDQAETGNT